MPQLRPRLRFFTEAFDQSRAKAEGTATACSPSFLSGVSERL
jgi:hypothetical protein